MFNIGPGELIVILIVALVLLGPDKLPEMARTVGKGMRELRRATEDLKDQVENEIYDLDPTRPTKPSKPRSPILKPPAGLRIAQEEPMMEPVVKPSVPEQPSLPEPSKPLDPDQKS